jgi:hypothetical protein
VRLLVLVFAVAGCGSSTLSGPCDLDSPCSDGEVCDFTAEGGPVCISASGDIDGDGIENGKDFCQHMQGGAFDEDKDGVGDDCDRCPIAPPRAQPDSDGDAVDSPCDPDPSEPGDEILYFEGFNGPLSADWKPTNASAWTVANGELSVNTSALPNQEFLKRNVIGKTNVAIEAGYKIDRVENSAPRHLVAVYADDPRPAGTAQVTCGVSRADATAGDLVFVQTNAGAMSQATVDPALLTTKSYRASAYMSGARAGCVVIADNMALGTVQVPITADDLSQIALSAQAVSVRYQYLIVVGH